MRMLAHKSSISTFPYTKIAAIDAEIFVGRPYGNWFETMSASISGSAYKGYEGDSSFDAAKKA